MASDAKATGNAISGALDKAASSQVQLPARIEEAIRAAPDIQAVNISVTASDKKLTLEGKVTSKAQRRRAKEIASTIAGDKFQIDDHLKINGDQ
jgi:osmotically-inducible protein OsmY